ncbi:hypothetical protein NIES4105_108790 (plasmid) [Calothrix sp. NIES-4105]|nr:hypothetical protein NIES4105_108790 [Calothrix sp. NIES-4105]
MDFVQFAVTCKSQATGYSVRLTTFTLRWRHFALIFFPPGFLPPYPCWIFCISGYGCQKSQTINALTLAKTILAKSAALKHTVQHKFAKVVYKLHY